MPIVLQQEFVSAKEAYITWTVEPDLISLSSKGFLYLTDITPSRQISQSLGVNSFPIVKYQLRASELNGGSHVFEDLPVGNYIAELSIITGNTSISSEPLTVNVYDLEAPLFLEVVPSNNSFTVTLVDPVENVQNVTFILLGKLIVGGNTQSLFDNSVTICLPYSNNNSYLIENVVNNIEYEIACFYTDVHGASSVLSDTRIETPTNKPNQITELAAVYNSAGQTLTITHNMPGNAADYDLVDCRATITNTVTNEVTYYLSSENSASLSPPPTPSDSIVFNMNNENLLPLDVPFTITLSVKNEIGHWGPLESPALYCIHSSNYYAVPLVASDLIYSVELNSISTSDNSTYVKNTQYVINYTAQVFECDVSGAIVGSVIASATQTNMNFNFNELTSGLLYKLVLNLNYQYTFTNNTTATINQQENDTCYYYFIPHDMPNQLSLTATPNDNSVLVEWSDSSVSDLQGFVLDHYEVSRDNVNWTSVEKRTSNTFTGLTNGSSYTFYARVVSASGSILYMSGSTFSGQTVSVTSVPYGSHGGLLYFSQNPGDTRSTLGWIDVPQNYFGGVFNKFKASVNDSDYFDIEPSSTTMYYDDYTYNTHTYVFENLTNLVNNIIKIIIVTNNVSNANNVNTTKSGEPYFFYTIPFSVPATPTGFVASPSTNTVTLNWDQVSPAVIINYHVKYEIYYKLETDSDFTIVSNIAANTHDITGLTPNSMYDFKIRSTIYNNETGYLYKSEPTSLIQSRPFIHLNAPIMSLEAGNSRIVVNLSPNTANYFQTGFKYHATIKNTDESNPLAQHLTVSDSNEQYITFTTLGNGTPLEDNTQYTIVAYYEMLNTDNNQYYSSDPTSNEIKPFDPNLAPGLTSVSHNKMITLNLDISAFVGYNITDHQISFDNALWTSVTFNSTVDSNILTKDVTVDQNGSELLNGTEYNVSARLAYFVNGENKNSLASIVVINTPYTESSVPTSIQSEPSNGQVDISWSAPQDFGGRILDHYQVKVDNGAWLNTGTNTSYSFTGLNNGTLYTFNVRAVTYEYEKRNLVEGAAGSTVNKPFDTASAPVILSYDEGDESVTVYWSEPLSLGGLEVIRYTVQIFNLDGSVVYWDPQREGSLEINSKEGLFNSLANVFQQLINGQEYIINVQAVTNHPSKHAIYGATATSSTVIPYKAATAPGFVSCVEGDSQLVLTWSEPVSLGGLVVDHYEVSNDQGVTWVNKGLSLSHTFTRLTNGQSYSLKVKAYTNHLNLGPREGAVLETSSFVPFKESVATTVTSEPRDGAVDFSWTAADQTIDGLPFAEYQISTDNSNWTSKNTNTHTLTGLNGVALTLYVRVIVTHPTGPIASSSASDTNIPYKPASPVDDTSYVTVPSDKQIVFSWTAVSVEEHGGLPFVRYEVSKNQGVNWVSADSNLSHTFTNLENGTVYKMLARVVTTHQYLSPSDVYGNVDADNWASNIPYKASAAPTNIVATPSNKTVSVSWDSVTELGGLGSYPYYYFISIDGVNGFETTSTNYTFNELENGTNYTFSIAVITKHPYIVEEIQGAESTVLDIVPYDFASKPVVSIEIRDQSLNLSWPTPDLGGLTIHHYELYYNSMWYNLNSVTDINSILGPNVTYVTSELYSFITFSELTNNQTYVFSVRAVTQHANIVGFKTGLPSLDVSGIPFGTPGEVSNIVSSAVNGYLVFSFTGPVDTNNNVFTQYYEYSIDNSVTFNPTLTTSTTAIYGNSPFTLGIRCYIMNPNDPSVRVYGITKETYNLQNINIDTPQDLKATVGDRTVTLTWMAVPDNEFEVIRYSTLGTVLKDYTRNNSYTFSELTNGTTYRFGVNIYVNGASGLVSNISAIPISSPYIIDAEVAKSMSGVLMFNVNFGGSSTVNVSVGAFYIDPADNKIKGKNVSYNNVAYKTDTADYISPNVNRITFPDMNSYTDFNITVSNSTGSDSGNYQIV